MPCDANATCEQLRGRNNFTCTYILPFVGNGFMCSRMWQLYVATHFVICIYILKDLHKSKQYMNITVVSLRE